jgi:uncharacterized protein YdaU (DUF1376 family)
MNPKNTIAIFSLTGFLLLASAGVSSVRAQDNVQSPTLIEKIIEKFNLNKSEVETVTNDFWTEKQKLIQERRIERLNQAVTDGTITQTQKEALEKKLQERYEERLKDQQEMQSWLSQQGIDREALQPYMGMGRSKFHGGFERGGMGMW